LAESQPVISVDTKKKELVGDFENAGREWRPQGSPEEMRAHDFLIAELLQTNYSKRLFPDGPLMMVALFFTFAGAFVFNFHRAERVC
jgi:hypothetical protein